MEILSIILLGLRAAHKNHIQETCTQLAYGKNFRLSCSHINSETVNRSLILTYVTKLIETMRVVIPIATTMHGKTKIYVNPS